ncbi:hypothetical protein ACFX13_004080 [Malus domestica]
MVMMPTLKWSLEPSCFETILPERGIPSPLLVDTLSESLVQVQNFGITREEVVPELKLLEEAQAWLDGFMNHIWGKEGDVPGPSDFHVNMTYILSAMFHVEHDQPPIMEGDYLATEPMMVYVSVEDTGQGEPNQTRLPEPSIKKPERIYLDKMVFACPSSSMANHLKLIYVTAHLEGVPFKRVLINGGAAVNVLPYKQMKKMFRSERDLIPTDLTVSSFSIVITKMHRILLLEVDLGSKQIMLAFFVVDSTSTYGALLGKDWIHQSLSVPSTLHQQVAVYHKEGEAGLGFWEMVEAESWPFLPTANVVEANFYNPSIGILQCSEADKNNHPTKVTAQKLLEQGLALTRE